MAFDLLVQKARIVDGSGGPSFYGDVAVKHGKIVEVGKLGGDAKRTIHADGLVVSPGFIDNHCHYDAQVLWDPLCSFSCYHGSTTVVFGNCSLGLAPAKPEDRQRIAGMLSYVEAIPMDVLSAGVDWKWTTFPEYMAAVGSRLGINAGTLIPHSAVRYYTMGEASQEDGRAATPDQLENMKAAIQEGMQAGALGMSITRNRGHYDLEGRRIAGACAPEEELFAVTDVLRQVGTGVIQCGGGANPEIENRLVSRLSAACGRRIMYNTILQSARAPERWKEHLAVVEATAKAGNRAFPMCSPNAIKQRFDLHNCQVFRGMEHWHPILISTPEEKLRAYSDPAVRQTLRRDLEAPGAKAMFSQRWDLMEIVEPQRPRNQTLKGKSVAQLAAELGKDALDAFLDLAVEEELNTVFVLSEINVDPEAVATLLSSPYTVVGLSDGGAHVQFDSGVSFSTRLLGYWVREQRIMSLEAAVHQITFNSASAFGIYDRGLIRPGMAADLAIWDADTIAPVPEDIVHDFPNNGWRIREQAEGVHYTVVNGDVLIEKGQHTGALPGRVLRNALYSNGK
ncbi:N-acyl-D-aspartate deacylase [Candidatus Entotheonellaceae bacterium PAL068K]